MVWNILDSKGREAELHSQRLTLMEWEAQGVRLLTSDEVCAMPAKSIHQEAAFRAANRVFGESMAKADHTWFATSLSHIHWSLQ